MIKKRLVQLLSHAKKYVFLQVLFNWLSLWCQIGIIWAVLYDSPFLLLDEPTSSLDALNESVILKSVNEAAKEKTVVIVSHRQSTLRCADEIFEMSALRKS